MAAYNGQGNYGTNRNFVSPFPRNNFSRVPSEQNTFVRRSFESDAPLFHQYNDTSGSGSFLSTQSSFSGYDVQTRGSTMLTERTNTVNMGNSNANRSPTQNTFSRPDLGFQSPFPRSEFSGKGVLPVSQANERNTYPRTEVSRDAFSRPQFSDNGMVSRPQPWNRDTFPGPPFGVNNIVSGPRLNRGHVHDRPQWGSGNMHSRPHPNSTRGMYGRPQFIGNPMPGISPLPQRMQFPYSSGVKRSPSAEWNPGRGTFMRHTRPQNTGTYLQKRPFTAIQPSNPKFKPNKMMKRNLSSELKSEEKKSKKLKPWMTDELYEEVKKKNKMFFKAKAVDSAELWQEFRLQRNKVSTLIKEAKMKGGFLVRKKKEDDHDGKEKPFSCDACDRAYAEESKLEEHLRDHKQCDADGCSFEAHPKVVELHKKMQHDTGYADKISKVDNAAEIEKWQKERKSNFPTPENIRKRQAEQEERLARGEVLETRDFGKFKKRRSEGQLPQHVGSSRDWKSTRGHRGRHRGRGRGRRSENRLPVGKLKAHEDSVSDSDDESHITLHKFPGTAVFTGVCSINEQADQVSDLHCFAVRESEPADMNSHHLNISSDSPAIEGLKQIGQLHTVTLSSVEASGALPCEDMSKMTEELVRTEACYKRSNCSSDSDLLSCVLNGQIANGEESEDEGPTVEPIVKETETTCQVIDVTQDISSDNDQKVHKAQENVVRPRAEKTTYTNPEQSKNLHGRYASNRETTLLETLLAKDIRRERNCFMQCIRYVLNNNFFAVVGQRLSKS